MLVNVITGERFRTFVLPVASEDKAALRKGWRFDWLKESKVRPVYKLTTSENPYILHGLVSSEPDVGFMFMHLVERAGYGDGVRLYDGIPQSLVAFVCQQSFEFGFEGVVAFDSKSLLFRYYEKTLHAKRLGNSSRMIVDTQTAFHLINVWL
ncbi:MAG: hypothetical protein IAF08_10025 [Rhizobacter sp.]|nr:hypothetical protein [Chlorobiales bacterium]